MVTRKLKMTIPQYRERKEIYDAIGYKETKCIEKDLYCNVTQIIDDSNPIYPTLHQYEKTLYKKGPSFFPIIILVAIAFSLLSCFVIFLGAEKDKFDLVSNSLYFLLPAFIALGADVIYTYFYFQINRKIIEQRPQTKADILNAIQAIKDEYSKK